MAAMAPQVSREVPVASPAEIASKILRRSQLSKMTRELQSRLTLANVKIQHGWENLSLSSIEPQIEKELKRKRSSSPTRCTSDFPRHATFPRLNSSPPSQTLCPRDSILHSDAIPASSTGSSHSGSTSGPKRARIGVRKPGRSVSSNHVLRKSSSDSKWKNTLPLPLSSPTRMRSHISPQSMFIHKPALPVNLPYGFSTSPVPLDSDDASPYSSETDDEDLPLPPPRHLAIPKTRSQNKVASQTSSHIRSSPPPVSTPPQQKFSTVPVLGAPSFQSFPGCETSADLLMFLTQSPSPAPLRFMNRTLGNQSPAPPSTPPSKFAPLPSTFMSGLGYPDFAPITPGHHLHFDDFLSFSPSPANQCRNSNSPSRRRTAVDATLPSVSIFADASLTSTSMSLFGGTLDLGCEL